MIADIECHVLSIWVDSICIHIQSASRIIPSTLHSHNGGAAGDFIVLMRSGDITPELTGRESTNQAFNLADDIQANSAPVE